MNLSARINWHIGRRSDGVKPSRILPDLAADQAEKRLGRLGEKLLGAGEQSQQDLPATRPLDREGQTDLLE